MTNYKVGKIYKIMYIGNENISINYIGSTFNTIRDRFRTHKSNYAKWINDKENPRNKNISIYPYFEKYNIENFKMILIKQYEIIDRNHLLAYEQLHMNKIKNINKQSAFQILTKEKKKETNKEYYKNNRDTIKEYYQQIKEKLKETYTCECSTIVRKDGKSRHERSKKHIRFLENKQ